MSPDSGISFLEIEEDGIETGSGAGSVVDFVLEVEGKLRGVTASKNVILRKLRKNFLRLSNCQNPW